MADPGPDIVTFEGRQMYRLHTDVLWAHPFDENSPMVFLWAPMGGIGKANLPFILRGDNGLSPVIQTGGDIVPLEYDDPTPDSLGLTQVAPATETTAQVLKLVGTQRKGPPGTNGTSTLNPATYGTPVYKRLLQVNAAANGFEYTPQKVGGQYWPTAVAAAPAASGGAFTVGTINVAANTVPFAWTPGGLNYQCVVTTTTADTQVDLVAHLGSTSGVVVGRCTGLATSLKERLTIASGPDPGTPIADITVAANAAATIYIRTEWQGGSGTYQSSEASSRGSMLAVPVL